MTQGKAKVFDWCPHDLPLKLSVWSQGGELRYVKSHLSNAQTNHILIPTAFWS